MMRLFCLSLCALLLTASLDAAKPPETLPPGGTHVAVQISQDQLLQQALQKVQSSQDYEIGPSDLLKITVYQEKDMDLELRVSQNGTIPFPLIGTVKIGKLTVANAVQMLQTQLAVYLVNPQVSILIKEYRDRKIFVLGEVKNSGAYPLPNDVPLTVLEAISLAGGFSDIAAIDKTRVMRKQGDKLETIYVDLSQITKNKHQRDALTLSANDIVFVPQTFF